MALTTFAAHRFRCSRYPQPAHRPVRGGRAEAIDVDPRHRESLVVMLDHHGVPVPSENWIRRTHIADAKRIA
jgi:hypothetical protein